MRWYYPELYRHEGLIEMLRQGLAVREICEMVGCTKAAIHSAIENHGIKRPFVEDVPGDLCERLRL